MKYIHPKLIIKGFNAERIKTEDINPSSVGTYEEWVGRQNTKVVIEKKLTKVIEITKFKF